MKTFYCEVLGVDHCTVNAKSMDEAVAALGYSYDSCCPSGDSMTYDVVHDGQPEVLIVEEMPE